MGSTENFWKPHSIKSGRDQPGNPVAQGEQQAPSPGLAARQAQVKVARRNPEFKQELDTAEKALQRQQAVSTGQPAVEGSDTPANIKNKGKIAQLDERLYGKNK